jgi:FMN-dependent NADH-azoreductase
VTTVLHISASPKGAQSSSGQIAEAFLTEYAAAHPDDEIVSLPLFAADLPEFGVVETEAKFAPIYGEALTSAQAAAWNRVEAEIERLKRADKVLLSSPMWNLGIPYKLKQYIDIIVQPRLSFTYDVQRMEHVGVLENRPLQLILTRSSVLPGDFSDFQLPYLKYIFEFIGIRDVRALIAWQTTQPTADDRLAYLTSFFEPARAAARIF